MRQRVINIGAVLIVCLVAAFISYRLFTPLKAQFGPSMYVVPENLLDAICAMPLAARPVPIPNALFVVDHSPMVRGPVSGPGCMIRHKFTTMMNGIYQGVKEVDTCQPSVCDGTRIRNYSESEWTEEGACDFDYYSGLRDCGRVPDAELKRGEYCTMNGDVSGKLSYCCDNDSYHQEEDYVANRPCADGLTCMQGWQGSWHTFACDCSAGTRWDNAEQTCVSIVPTAPAVCGNGTKETGEECDDGSNNTPSATANKSWLDITPADETILARSSCLDTCTIAQCSNKKNDDRRNGADKDDRSCYGGPYGNVKYLAGYNVEDCPMCEQKKDEDENQPVTVALPDNALVASTVRQFNPLVNDVPNLDLQYCKGGQTTFTGKLCSCTSRNEVCFAENITDAAGTITSLGKCDCKPLNPSPDLQKWTWACKTDKNCSKNYRCAYYSTYKYLVGSWGNDIDIYRCRKLFEDGDEGCRSRWDCKSRYLDTTIINRETLNLNRDPDSRTKCLEVVTPRCCNPDASDPSKSCKRPSYSGTAAVPIPSFDQCATPTGGGAFAGGDNGGWGDGGGNSGDGGDGGVDSGSSGSNGSASSAAACFNQNPCLASTLIGAGRSARWTYTIPPSCPISGNQRTCYTGCVAAFNVDISTNPTNAFVNFNACSTRTCRVDDDDLKMCPCNDKYRECFVGCVDENADCRALCAFDSNPIACGSACTGQQRSCLNECGRACPASVGSSARSSTSRSSGGSSHQSSNFSSRSSGSSKSSSRSSSNGSNNSNGSQSSGSAHSSASNKSSQGSEKRSSVSSKSGSSHSGSLSSKSMSASSRSGNSSVSSSHSGSSGNSKLSISSRSSVSSSHTSGSSTSSKSSASSQSSTSSTYSSFSFGTGIGGVDGTVVGIGGDIAGQNGGLGGISGQTSSSRITKDIPCTSDENCPQGTRCILNRCLTTTDIAQLPSFCGNAKIDLGELCDNGAANATNPNAYCRPDCTLGRCGDAIIDTPLEQCDDGNNNAGDGCTVCRLERNAPTTLPATTVELPFVSGGQERGGQEVRNNDLAFVIPNTEYPIANTRQIPSTPDTGPAALAIMIAGGAAGWLYKRRR